MTAEANTIHGVGPMVGTVHKKQPMMLHRAIGKARPDNGDVTLEVMISEPLGTPFIVHSDGRAFTMTWDEIIGLAVEAFEKDAQPVSPQEEMAMPEPQRKSLAELQAQVDAWNAQYAVGSLVSYESLIGEGETHRGATRVEAFVAGGHSACVTLEGKTGWVSLDHCRVLVGIEPDHGDAAQEQQPEPMARCAECSDVHPVKSRKRVPDPEMDGVHTLVCPKCGHEDYFAQESVG